MCISMTKGKKMSTKKDLEQEVKELKKSLEVEQSRPTGHTITGCHIEAGKDKIAIANAVAEGMKALQMISEGDSYGIYLEGND